MSVSKKILAEVLAVVTAEPMSNSEIWHRVDCWSRTHIRLTLIELCKQGLVVRFAGHDGATRYRLAKLEEQWPKVSG